MDKIKFFLISLLCIILPNCNNNLDSNAMNLKNKIDLRSFFNGELDGWGIILDHRGRQIKSFYIKMQGSWNANKGTLKEWFEFDNGEKTTRQWDLNFENDQIFTAVANDVIGTAKGKQKNNLVNVKYTLQIPYGNRKINLSMDDWMYMVQEDVVLNRTSMKKFGFKVGELLICMKKKPKQL